jgi:hypothetical protein
MLQRDLINDTLEKYRKLKNFDVEIDKLLQEVTDCCESYINSIFPKEVLEQAKKSSSVLRLQDDINIYYYYTPPFKGITTEMIRLAGDFFPKTTTIPLQSLSLPLLFSSYDLFSSRNDSCGVEFRKRHPEFIKNFGEKYSKMIECACKYSKKLVALRTVLSSKEATLTRIKENYPELYNLIKS